MEQAKADHDENYSLPQNPIEGYRSGVDSSRPFSSVKEAVAIFGQRIHLPAPTQTPKSLSTSPSHRTSSSSSTWKQPSLPCSSSNPREEIMDILTKLEAELKETKTELKLLKEKESETEVALATLNAEIHKNMSKIAKAEAEAAGKSAASMSRIAGFDTSKEINNEREISVAPREEDRRKELMRRMEREYPTLAHILDGNKGNREVYYGKKKKKKKKPIVPLFGDFFFKTKEFSGKISEPLSSHLH